jgi:hypothetical protein
VATFVKFVEAKAGLELLEKIASQIPAIRQWLPS